MSLYSQELLDQIVITGASPVGKPPVDSRQAKVLDSRILMEIVDDAISGSIKPHAGLHFSKFKFDGILNLSSRTINFPIYFESCIFEEFVEMWCLKCKTLSFSGTILLRGADLRSSEIDGGLFLRDGFRCFGPLLLRDMNVTQTIDLQKAELLYSGGASYPKHADADGESISLSRTTATALYWKDLISRPQGKVNLRDVKTKIFQTDLATDPLFASWPSSGQLILEGFHYGRMTSIPTERALKWLQLQGDITTSSLSSLAESYKQENLLGNYRTVMSEIRKKEILQIEQYFIRYIVFLFFYFIDFGARPQRAIYIVLFVMSLHVLGVAIIDFRKGIGPNVNEMLSDSCFSGTNPSCDAAALSRYKKIILASEEGVVERYVPHGYPKFDALMFSIENFVPFIDTGQRKYWQVEDIKFRLFLSIMAPLALFISGIFVGSISGFFDK